MNRKKLTAVLVALLLAGCASQRFTDHKLLRIDGDWVYPPPDLEAAPSAPATILEFRSGGEFIEHRCWVIKNPGDALTVSGGDPHVVVVGNWRQSFSTVTVSRSHVRRTVRVIGGTDPLCRAKPLAFTVVGQSLVPKDEAPQAHPFEVVKIDCSDWETYVDEAKAEGDSCDGA